MHSCQLQHTTTICITKLLLWLRPDYKIKLYHAIWYFFILVPFHKTTQQCYVHWTMVLAYWNDKCLLALQYLVYYDIYSLGHFTTISSFRHLLFALIWCNTYQTWRLPSSFHEVIIILILPSFDGRLILSPYEAGEDDEGNKITKANFKTNYIPQHTVDAKAFALVKRHIFVWRVFFCKSVRRN